MVFPMIANHYQGCYSKTNFVFSSAWRYRRGGNSGAEVACNEQDIIRIAQSQCVTNYGKFVGFGLRNKVTLTCESFLG